ncbi:MAG: ABC transporter ATP-binding protein [Bacteroidetes bacterium]|nr:ABC transporter ATP-binding protein [Bacteroidota bacterium]
MLSCTGIVKSYGALPVLKGISLEVQSGEIVSITGESGAGKSTLLHILGTLDKPDSGTVTCQGQVISGFRGNKLADFRNAHIGFVFQFHQLLPEFNALENVCIPAWIAGVKKSAATAKAQELMSLLGLRERASHKPNQLSGGEQQRVAIARALINGPAVVLADEPSGNLDSANAEMLHKYFFRLRDEMGQTFVIVTHNPQLAAMADRNLKMRDGVMI